MIARLWHGWTTIQNADAYENLLKTEVFPGIVARGVPGFRRIELLRRRSGPDEMEFITIMRFDTFDAVKEFAGADYETAYVPAAARAVLSRFDAVSQHYEVREEQVSD